MPTTTAVASDSPPKRAGQRLPLLLGLAALAAFALLTFLVQTGSTAEWDRNGLLAMLPLRTELRTRCFQLVSFFGVGEFAIPAGLAIFFWLRRTGHPQPAAFYAGVTLGGWAFNLLLKQLIGRPRPDVIPHLGRGGWFTYPSGHSMMSPLVYGLGGLMLAKLLHRAGARAAVRTVAALTVVGVALSRVYLGVHYPSDVLGGLLAGCGWGLLWWGLKPPRLIATADPA